MNSTSAVEISTQAVSPESSSIAPIPFVVPTGCRKDGATLFPGGSRLFPVSEPIRTERRQLRRGVQAPYESAGNDVHRVPHRAERRGVAEVEVDHLFGRQPGLDGGGQHVDPLGRALLAHDLRPEHPAGTHLGQGLDRDALALGQVARPALAVDAGLDGARTRSCSTSPSDSPVRPISTLHTLVTAVPSTPGKAAYPPADVDARHPALLVGDRAEGDVHGRPSHQVERLAAVARRPHALGRGALPPVDPDGARRPRRRCPPPSASSALGRTPRPSTTRSAGRRSPAGDDRAVLDRLERSSPRRTSTPRPPSASASGAAMSASSVGISWSDRSTSVTSSAPLDERLGHLQADVAPADHHDPAAPRRRGRRARARRRRRASARRGRSAGRCPGGRAAAGRAPVAMCSVSNPTAHAAAGVRGPTPRPAGVEVERPDLVPEAHVDAVLVAERLRAAGHQVVDVADRAHRRGRGCRRPSSWSTGPSRARRSRGRAVGGAPAWRRSCPPRRRR